MWWCRTCLLPLLVSSLLLLAGAIGQQPPAGPPQTPPAPPANPPATPPAAPGTSPSPAAPKADAEATKVLKEAIDRLDPKRLKWVQTTFWQQADVQGLTYQAEGKYLAAPDQRLRLELSVRLGETTGTMDVVCDGSTMWQMVQVGGQPRLVTKVDLKKVLEGLSGQPDADQVRQEFFQNQAFTGLAPLLQGIQQRMTVTGREKVRWQGREVTRLTAVWSADVARSVTPPDKPWPPYLAQECQLYLEPVGADGALWPRRLEWWGPSAAGASPALLLQMEFRDPKLNQPLPAEQVARAFHFDPGPGEVPDMTQQMAQTVKSRAQQLAAQKKSK
jgi:hypothetical protein